ncbi:hypothetical protein DIPPA_24422 [Diplonema papillatum]|nr:hypothetical protein DIPPA_24422 [Diplonema papillatum]
MRAGRRLAIGFGFGVAGSAFASTRTHADDCSMNWDALRKQNSETSNELIRCLSHNAAFAKLSGFEKDLIVSRDEEDTEKLWKGIEISIHRGVLPRITPPAVQKIDVQGKTPQQVAATIVDSIPDKASGSVIVLQGMSGTGKGTTTATLLERLPNSVSWSNGNVFRSLTLLAATHCQQSGEQLASALTADNVSQWMEMLSFERVAPRQYEIRIRGLGFNTTVSQIQNTVLKEPIVAKNIPTVAQQTQGDVVKFAASALRQMSAEGMNVVLEGREATVQYVPTPYRFELVLSDPSLLGKRRAAQRLMAAVYQENKANGGATDERIMSRVEELCQKWAANA